MGKIQLFLRFVILTILIFTWGIKSSYAKMAIAENKIWEEDLLAQSDTEMTEGQKANANFQDIITGKELVNSLQKGGYIIYIRHVQTEKDYADQVTATMGDCSTQRMLSEKGWQQARAIGNAFQKYNIPVGMVISSQYCRAWQTADLAFGKYEKNGALNFPKSEDYTDAEIKEMRNQLTPLLIKNPSPGENTVLVGHDDLFEAVTGIYPEPQGMAYILQPDGRGGFKLIANIKPEEWQLLSSN